MGVSVDIMYLSSQVADKLSFNIRVKNLALDTDLVKYTINPFLSIQSSLLSWYDYVSYCYFSACLNINN